MSEIVSWKEKIKERFGFEVFGISDLDNYNFPGDKRKTNINRCLEEIGYKQCTRCKEILPFSEFYKSGKYYKSKCKECSSIKKKITHENFKEFLQYEKKYLKELSRILKEKKKLTDNILDLSEWLEYKDIYSLTFSDKMSELNAFHEICAH